MIFAWPLVCLGLFARLPVDRAAIWSILGGYLILPSATSYDVGSFPALDKHSVPAITVFALCWMKGTRHPARRSLVIYLLACGFVIAPILTSINNSYELQIGETSLRGFYPLDGLKLAIRNLVQVAPFFIGMRFVSSDNARAYLVKSLAIAAIFYSIPMLFEIRFSPNLHYFVYGFAPTDFVQAMRGNGFRPVVFLNHGLSVAMFTSIAVAAGSVAMRARWHFFGKGAGWATSYLSLLLLLCKSMASIIYAIVAVPLVLFARPKTWLKIALALSVVVLAYPILRTYEFVPTKLVLQAANTVSPVRQSSLEFRIENEDRLLGKANEKPFFGWGTWGRNRAYSNQGVDDSVTDGEWIIQYGQLGLFGYFCLFGLFVAAVWRARASIGEPVTEARVVTGGLALIVAVSVLDLIPNAGIIPLTYLTAGSLASAVSVRAHRSVPRQSSARQRSAVPTT